MFKSCHQSRKKWIQAAYYCLVKGKFVPKGSNDCENIKIQYEKLRSIENKYKIQIRK